MQVDQAIVSSIDSKTEQKNELVSRSANIDDQLAGNLLRWSPCRQEIALGHAESINFFATDCGRLALSRSVIGGQESRRSGGRRTLTYIVVLTPPQLAGFGGNAVRLTRVLQSSGQLILHTQGTPTLPLLEIPDRCFHEFRHSDSHDTIFEDGDKLVRALEIHGQVVIIGRPDPLSYLFDFFEALPQENRSRISFSTGLNVVAERPFQLQFFAESNPILDKQLTHLQRRTIRIKSGRDVPAPAF